VRTALILLTTALWVAACGARVDGPPEIVVDRSACSHCGMLISERIYAAALRTPHGGARVFDDIGCLLAAVPAPLAAGTRVWFHDAADASWIEAKDAVFVVSRELRTPMSGGVIAYRDRATARREASRLGGTVALSIDELRQIAGVKR
jgi:copper chaperone NosL